MLVLNALERLFEVSGDLRDAMLARDPERIQQVVQRQDELRQLAMPEPALAGQDWKDDPEVSSLANRLHRLQQSNRLLASAFLGIYRNTLNAVSRKTPDPGLYGRSGALLSGPRSSMLVQQTG
jgi:hypothetical protein